ncbi:COA4 Cytochrome oxidase assembly factor 4 [Candida maltosa Xu316]|uniref:CHCH domain-containing protein n=1 Tax=Candida maltosa (strain Xu316) TaxID=1245528 RepID=M3ITG9_CANMX|nr:hypothetical protein G210_5278 [Candida maltosa Xu316]
MQPTQSTTNSQTTNQDGDDDEPDEWDQRILKTGCHDENLKLQLCHADTGDWRKCLKEMQLFRECWERNKNNERTSTVDNNDL